ncbi:MAG: hypothetical protein HY305_07200, partial [Sphingobacteriales bacterium]|nr:hypothetical protein [Sphingobacteriales bacterium]
MTFFRSNKIILTAFFVLLASSAFCQLPYNLLDGRKHFYCDGCSKLIDAMPAEVLFGVQIKPNGDVYFLMNNREWFDKIFKNNYYGIT